MLQIKGLGPRRVKLLQQLNIRTKAELKQAIKNDILESNHIFSKKIINNIKKELSHPTKSEIHFRLFRLIPVIESILLHLKMLKEVKEAEACGNYRRKTEIVNDVDIVVVCNKASFVINEFLKFPQIKNIFSVKPKLVTVKINIGIVINLRIVSPKEFAAALLFYTGTPSHYIKLKNIAKKKQLILKKWIV